MFQRHEISSQPRPNGNDGFFERLEESLLAPWDTRPFDVASENNKPRVLYIGFSDQSGGAAIASARLIDRLSYDDAIVPLEIAARTSGQKDRTVSMDHAHRFPLWKKTWQATEAFNRLRSDPYGWLPLNSAFVGRAIRMFRPDIIHCNNLHGGIGVLPISDLVSISKITPVVWTLHDMWALTGHCAYSMACDRWRTGCGGCPDLSLYPAMLMDRTRQFIEKKKNVFRGSDITFVSPSHWLHTMVGEAPATQEAARRHIPNGLDLDVFKAVPVQDVRTRFGIGPDDPVLLFAAESLDGDLRKGTLQLRNALLRVSDALTSDLHVLLVGGLKSASNAFDNIPHIVFHELGYLSEPNEIVRYFSAADLFLCPSLQDNLPNILLETHACGTAAVTFDSGGCAEVVADDQTGLVVPTGDTHAFADAVLRLLETPAHAREMGRAARMRAEELFSDRVMAARYLALYKECLSRRAA